MIDSFVHPTISAQYIREILDDHRRLALVEEGTVAIPQRRQLARISGQRGRDVCLMQALDLRKIGWPGLAVLGVRSSQAAGQTQQRVHDNPEEE